MPISSWILCLAVLAGLPSASVLGQVVRIGAPNAALPEEFSSVRGVRELPDGRVLVSDYLDQRVVVVDFERGTVVTRVSKGGGPREARLPTRLVPALGDSTLLVDLGNNRLLVLDAAGQPARTIAANHQGVMGVRGMDRSGALYYAIPGWAEAKGALPDDSVRVVRWSPQTDSEETLAVIQGERMRSDIRQPSRVPRIPVVGYAAQDAWVVTDAGVLRIVRAGGYRVESRARGAAAASGPSYAYATRPVSAADRRAFVQAFNATSPMSGKGENGGMGFSPALSASETAAMVAGTQFAERHPMFDASRVIAGSSGQLWVGRPAETGKPVLYDVFDASGRRVLSVELLPGRRVMALGRQNLYVVAESDFGIQQLERYALPR